MGIRPLTPGFEKILIQPNHGSLAHASIKLPTIKGPIHAAFENSPGQHFTLTVDIPPNTSAKIAIPAPTSPSTVITLNEKNVSLIIEGTHIILDNIPLGEHTIKLTFPQ